jgi:hypothetical protein
MMQLTPIFTDTIPAQLENGVLYISMKFHTASHNCACGCGKRIVTPFSPVAWQLTYDGKTVSLDPSISNSGSECLSHYWIINNQVKWSYKMSKQQINRVRERDLAEAVDYYEKPQVGKSNTSKEPFKARFIEFWKAFKRLFFVILSI